MIGPRLEDARMDEPCKPTILVIDDDPSFHDIVRHMLADQRYDVSCVADPTELDDRKYPLNPSAILLDWKLDKHDGTTLIDPLRRRYPLSPIIFVTGYSSLEIAATSIKLGAFDFITKPLDESRLLIAAAKAVEHHQLLAKLHQFEEATESGFVGLIGMSAQMQTVYSTIRNVAPTDVNVMISGESGTGKELVAAAIHQRSDRSTGPFVALNMASIPDDLVDATLYGHEKGAFTGAEKERTGAIREAAGGTLFLDEITEMPMRLQSKLLRFLQESTFRSVGANKEQVADTRIISAANRDPAVAVREKRLREDLYYRLNVVPIQLPPLRERDGDIPLLVHHAVRQLAKKHGKEFTRVHWKVLETLTRYDWPGNVRELMHALERIVVMHNGEVIELHMLPVELLQAEPSRYSLDFVDQANGRGQNDAKTQRLSLGDFASKEEIVPLEDLERRALSSALELCDGSAYEAARRLNVSTATIYRKIKLFNLRSH
jgi:two-component system repressor protein LuxO